MAMKIVETKYETCYECPCCGAEIAADILPPTEHLGEEINPVCPICDTEMKLSRIPIYIYEDDD